MGSYLRKNWKKSTLVCLLQIVEWGFQAGVQLLLMQVFDKALSLDLKAFLFWSAVDMAAWGGYFLVCYLRESAQARVVRALNNDLRNDLCCQLLQKGYQDYHKQDSGEYLSWMTNDIKQIEQLDWNPFFNCVGRASQVLWGIVVLLSLHWSLMAASLVSAPSCGRCQSCLRRGWSSWEAVLRAAGGRGQRTQGPAVRPGCAALFWTEGALSAQGRSGQRPD